MHFPLSQILLISLSILPSLVTSAPVPVSSPDASPQVNRPSWRREAEPEPQGNGRPSWKRDQQEQDFVARSWSAVVPPNKFNRSPEYIVL